jgi:hypothetical protein
MSTNNADATDFKFGLGETVSVGDLTGSVVAIKCSIDRQDEYEVAFPVGDDGLPFTAKFMEWQIHQPTKH